MKSVDAVGSYRAPLFRVSVLSAAIGSMFATGAWAAQTGPIDPVLVNVPKYVIPLVIPPEMPKSKWPTQACPPGKQCPVTTYNIAQRQFQQQILPGGIWNALNGRTDAFGATTVWSYGSAKDPIPRGFSLNGVQVQAPGIAPVPATQSSFNFPSFTVENQAHRTSTVRWINELVALNPITGKPYWFGDKRRTPVPHLTAIDRTMHFANPERMPCTDPVTGAMLPGATECRPYVDPVNPDPRLGQSYTGPVPMVVHVHGAETSPYSDGFTESWWMPSGVDPKTRAPLSDTYAMQGSRYDQEPAFRTNGFPGSAVYSYGNSQPATTLWFHDHTLGMTANNVYAGPAGFWLIRGDYKAPNGSIVRERPVKGYLPGSAPFGRPTNPTSLYGKVKGCDPNFDAVCREKLREIPIVIQDRSFNQDGSLFYPDTRAFFDGGNVVPYLPAAGSDVSPIHNPEFFGNMMVVNGTVWPTFDVVSQRYRLRLLAGANSRTFNLSLWAIPPGATLPDQNSATYLDDIKAIPGVTELPFYQIGSDQGFLPKVAKVMTGTVVALPGNGTQPAASCTLGVNPIDPECTRGLLMGPAERPDVIVDFTGLPPGTKVRMVNTGPDVPFGGFPIAAPDLANPGGTGQVMEFNVVASTATTPPDNTTPPAWLVLSSEPANADPVAATRRAAIIEEDSEKICVTVDLTGALTVVGTFATPQADIATACTSLDPAAIPFGPTDALVGTMINGIPQLQGWMNPITEAPTIGDTEIWEVYNYTVDAHPMHLHAARFQVIDRELLAVDALTGAVAIPAALTGTVLPPDATEAGYKDTVLSLPGYVTRFKANFELPGLYVWHCHIVEHEDNEMMVPICIKNAATDTACTNAPGGTAWPITNGGLGLTY